MRRWQEEHGFSSLPLLRNKAKIETGITEIETPEAGTGPKLKTWLGWIPHRVSICKYEEMNDGFILHHQKKVRVITTMMSKKKYKTQIETPREQSVVVHYSDADKKALRHASVVAHECLVRISPNFSFELTGANSVSTDILSRAKAIHNNDKAGDHDVALLLYEIAATETGNEEALESAVKILVEDRRNPEDVERAISLLERFYIPGTGKKDTNGVSPSGYDRFQSPDWVHAVESQYRTVLAHTAYSPRAAVSYANFCAALSFFTKEDISEAGRRALSRSLVYSAFVNDKLSSYSSRACLEGLIDTSRREMFLFGCNIHSNFILFAQSASFASLPGRSRVAKRKAEAQNRLAILYFYGAEGIPPSKARAKELYEISVAEGNFSAMNNLALPLQKGTTGVPPDPLRAKELYEKAIDKNNNVDAMNNLALLLEKGADGVPPDPRRAVQLYNRAINEGIHVHAMHNLAMLLEQGAHGVDRDPSEAQKLFSRSLTEVGEAGINISSFLDGVETDPQRIVDFYDRAIQKGDVDLMVKYADLLLEGSEEIDADLSRAKALFELAIKEHENVYAMHRLSDLLESGDRGFPKNPRRVLKLRQQARAKDNPSGRHAGTRDIPGVNENRRREYSSNSTGKGDTGPCNMA